MLSELKREALSEVKDKIIKDVIHDLDVFSCVHELNDEQSKEINIISLKLCLLVEELQGSV